MRKMLKFHFEGSLEIPVDTFEGEYGSCPGSLFYYAFMHGHGSGDFYTYLDGKLSVDEYEETE